MINQEVKKDILSILKKAVEYVDDRNYRDLKELSDHTIHNSSIYQDMDSTHCAILLYALSKIIERNPFYIREKAISALNRMVTHLKKDDIFEYREEQKQFIEYIKNTDNKVSHYIVDVLQKAGLKKGLKVYEHGVSLSKAAELFGVSIWELSTYAGKTTSSDRDEPTTDILKRMDFTRKLFYGEK